jgi:nitrate/nitrite transporter NarK
VTPAVDGSAMSTGRQDPGAYRVLFASTFAFMVCFAVWMMFGVIGIRSGKR